MPRTILLHLLKLIKILRLNPFTNFQTVLIFSQLRPVSFVYITSTSNNYINSIKGETRGGGGAMPESQGLLAIYWMVHMFSIFPVETRRKSGPGAKNSKLIE